MQYSLVQQSLSTCSRGLRAQPSCRRQHPGDAISWLDNSDPASSASEFLEWARKLRLELNAAFYTGLKSEEFHFARYAVGQGYTTHMDQHRGNPHRRISLVLYLNRNWGPEDGGELCLYSPDDPSLEIHRILPQPGRLVLFRSDVFPHAVLPANKPRLSLSGWFRTDERN
ncbi:2OG-Fe(II) oxygenase [Paenalcaligenes niemegkensis]|uniref:2OG-Fe(II) oxygenase n=1 Tax=Paenalcaligenes niemegkensis TaxID=2895469 RepID=UPI001EE94F73|nr:2OG-Fe(II) oxygenase [Paenalcaligenes niemegkensis]MCQ9617086.1 2OG-Fe(II) oxygenase [Paenalcaligenes niemegkensis]